ncbi:hemin receptor [Rhizobium leguminosarum]|uniref:Hemin receptor n=1 Tax=Rhizobium leguminosarum TaxID=384 RepID=A0A6P0B7M7_RHILE|nr:globin family protein [Rhizobium leguminosarum]NEI35907.1 hemin receptor [Rhizobium leguminosarum]NEI42290.1 hemin receptor [Rhizobium leguminosarum]
MNPHNVSLVQESFKKLVPRADQVGLMFYGRLFETFPDVRPMFAEDISLQSRKLVQMLAVVVNSLHKLETILPAVKDLGHRQRGYGVVEAHYEAVGLTLIWTLRRSLDNDFTAEVEGAWSEAFRALSGAMISAANEPPSA